MMRRSERERGERLVRRCSAAASRVERSRGRGGEQRRSDTAARARAQTQSQADTLASLLISSSMK